MTRLSQQFQIGHYLSVQDQREAWYVRRDNLVVALQVLIITGDAAMVMLNRDSMNNDELLTVTPTDGGAWMFSDLGQHWTEPGHMDYRTKECPLWPEKPGCWYGGSTLMAMRLARVWSEHKFDLDWLYKALAEAWEETHT